MLNRASQSFLKIGLVAACAALGACSASVGGTIEPVGVDEGSLTVDWTVDGTKDSLACFDFGADQIEIVVYDFIGEAARAVAACEDFEISIVLPDGDYSADATMLDVESQPISTTLSLDDIAVRAGTDLEVDIDFPVDSFY
jgi:hypothetical protein